MPLVVRPLRQDLQRYLLKHGLVEKLEKQVRLFQNNPRHPSLQTELLEPKQLKIYSFRIDRRYRSTFIYRRDKTVEIIDVNLHYS